MPFATVTLSDAEPVLPAASRALTVRVLIPSSVSREFQSSVIGMLLDVFFFNDTATTEIYTLSLHDALPIFPLDGQHRDGSVGGHRPRLQRVERSEEHTSELQSHVNLVCRLLLEKKKTN